MLKFNLFENGVDSIKHGIEHFIKSEYKYAILHVFHGVELLQKEALRRIHPKLIYKNIDKLITEDSYTVGFNSLIGRLQNFNLIGNKEIGPLIVLKNNRNRIAHKDISLDTKEKAEDMLGEALKYISKFSAEKLESDLKDYVGEDNWNKIEEIIYSYEERLKKALDQVDERLPVGKEALISDEGAYFCPHCGNETVVFVDEKDDYECLFCHEPIFIFTCERCNMSFALAEERDEQPCDACWESLIGGD